MTRRYETRPVQVFLADTIAGIVDGLQRQVERKRAQVRRNHTRHIIDDLPAEIRKDIGWR